MTESIESEQGTDQEIATGLACSDCSHVLNKDHTLDNCYGLSFDGTIWIACKCKRFKSSFSIKTNVYENTIKETRESRRENESFIPTFKKVS